MFENRLKSIPERYILIITAVLLLTQITRIYNFWVKLVRGEDFLFSVIVSGGNEKCQFKLNNWPFFIENCHKYQTGSELKLIGRLSTSSDKQLFKTKKLNVKVISINKNPITSVLGWIDDVASQMRVGRDRVIKLLMGYMPNAPLALLIDMPFGQIVDLPEPIYHDLKTIGMLHIVAASGYNVGLVAGLVGVLAARFGRPHSFLIWCLGMMLYLFLSDFSISILRAYLMFLLKKAAESAGRVYHNFLLLTTAVFLFLLLKPWLFLNLSFQLSVGATLGLILFSEKVNQPLSNFFRKINFHNQFTNLYITEPLATALAAQLITTPILLWHFGEITAFSFVANLVLLWMTPFLTIGGLILFTLGAVGLFLPFMEKFIAIFSIYIWFYADIFIKLAVVMAQTFLFEIKVRSNGLIIASFTMLIIFNIFNIFNHRQNHAQKTLLSLG